jgi:hypothetical protein
MTTASGSRELPEIREARAHIARSALKLISWAAGFAGLVLALISPAARGRSVALYLPEAPVQVVGDDPRLEHAKGEGTVDLRLEVREAQA